MTVVDPAPAAVLAAEVLALRVDRVAGLAAERLPLALARADALAARLDAVEEALLAAGSSASEDLHALVPLLEDDRALRRTALALRRTTRSAAPQPTAEAIERVRGALLARGLDGAPLTTWAVLAIERTALAAEYAEAVEAGVARATRALEALRDDDGFLSAVADASPDFAAAPGRDPLLPHRHSTRSLLSYAGRAAVKTSPFGTLTTVGIDGEPAAQPTAAVTHAYAAAWLDVLAHDEVAAHAFAVEPLGTAGLDAATDAVAVPALLESSVFVWRRTVRTALRGTGESLRLLQPLGRVPLARMLAAIGGDDPFAAYVRLLDAGVLRTVAPWQYGDRDTLDALAARLLTAVPQHPAGTLLMDIAAEARAVTAERGRERGRRRAALRDRAEAALAAHGVDAARRRFEVYVDAAPADPVEALPAAVATELDRYTASVARTVRRSSAYRAVVACFVAAQGRGAEVSAWPFLLAAAEDDVLRSAVAAGASSDALDPPRGRSMPLPSATIAVQVVAGDDLLVVINQLLPGQGGLITRFRALHPGLGARLADRAARLAAGARPVEIVPSWDVNGMQAAAAGTLPRLRLPGDRPLEAERPCDVDLAALRIRHDPRTDALDLLAPDGAVLAPFHLGLVPAHLLSGPERVLTILADPWTLPRSGTIVHPVLVDPESVSRFPRRTNGRIVTRRAMWTVPCGALPPVVADDAELLRAVGRWRRGHGIPSAVFVRLVRTRPGSGPTARKPLPVELTSPHALRQLFAMLTAEVRGLEITEALPSAAQHAHRDRDGGRRAVEHLLLVDLGDPDAHDPHPSRGADA